MSTLDNISGLGIRSGQQLDLLAGLSDENVARVRRQNRAKISVVIGNPPYNANQQNENDNNKNRTYPHIDELIKQTYVKQSTAQKTKQYDMYTRFFRWATDRLGDDGVIAFITNNSFAKKANYDGFRKIAAEQFCDIYVIDFKGDARSAAGKATTSLKTRSRSVSPSALWSGRRPLASQAESTMPRCVTTPS